MTLCKVPQSVSQADAPAENSIFACGILELFYKFIWVNYLAGTHASITIFAQSTKWDENARRRLSLFLCSHSRPPPRAHLNKSLFSLCFSLRVTRHGDLIAPACALTSWKTASVLFFLHRGKSDEALLKAALEMHSSTHTPLRFKSYKLFRDRRNEKLRGG